MRKNRRPGLGKEKIIMLSASLFVLSALTMTGVYVKEKNKSDNDGYVVDLSTIEKQAGKKAEEIQNAKDVTDSMDSAQLSNDMDVDPAFQEANSGNVKNTVGDTIQIPGVGNVEVGAGEADAARADSGAAGEEAKLPEEEGDSVEVSAGAEAVKPAIAYQFDEGQMLQWPVMGNVVLNYSMDKTIYFPSLEQYKCNPSIVIAAKVGDPVKAAVSGEVSKVFTDPEIGTAITVEIGNGYQATYGQLDKVQAAVGENIEAGMVIGYVAAPTKYYSVEGSNVYFRLDKDGIPVNPLNQLQ